MRRAIKSNITYTLAVLLITLYSCSSSSKKESSKTEKRETETVSYKKTRLAFGKAMPEKYNSPDGLTVGKDGNIYLSMNNAGNFDYPAKIMRITEDETLEEFTSLPADSKTGVACPLGIVFGADGNLYISDNQSFATETPNSSRLLKVTVKDGKAVKTEVVATGFNMANGITTFKNYIYVAETNVNGEYPLTSGVYRFNIDDLDGENPIRVEGLSDPKLIVKIKTKNRDHQVGANGVAIDSKGDMFICNFGDAEILKVDLNESGDVINIGTLVQGKGMISCDGMQIDSDDNIWVADFLGNAVAKIDSKSGAVEIVAKNGQTDGANGELDAPSECIHVGDKVYISNIDINYGENSHDKVHTISVIDL